ncbi:MAG: glycosyltransferase family 4 protein [Prolixibacteraceae bacterium]|nr:glycosyltransferase family 4 protein [Prolixibacteraceae bacterium]MBN2773577.1 glycosyltransferase family 4 protein [Prolixibacteraceae bacterium]
MKIGFDAKRAFLNRAGLGNYSRNTLISLKKYFPENEYTLFTPEIRKDIFPEQSEFDIVSPDSPALKIFQSLWRSFSLSGILEKHKIDLFHGMTNELPSGIHKTGTKSVVTIHDLIFLHYPQYYKSVDRKIYYQKVKYACSAANKIIAISTQTKEDIIRFFNVDPSRIEVVFQGISERFCSESGIDFSVLKEKYNLPDQYILSVGTIEPRKNQLNILKGIHSAQIETPVVFIGKPTQYALKISEFAEKNKIGDKVFILNQVSDDELPALYRNALMLAYISEYEGFGLPIIEAMACGCPVLTSNTSCLPETGGNAALYCDPGNHEEIGIALKKIVDDQILRKELIEKGKNRAEKFSLEKTSSKILDVYKNIL